MYRRDVVRLQIQLRGFHRNAFGNLVERVSGAANDSAGAGAGGRAVVLAQAALVVVSGALELVVWQLVDGDVLNLGWAGTSRRGSRELILPQPVREPSEVAGWETIDYKTAL